MNINFVDDNLRDLVIPSELFLKIYLLRCHTDLVDCTTPGGRITDFHAWDRPFSLEELQHWTVACE